jgi:hypothetical protein
MTWLPLLLADRSPCLRWLVLRQLFNLPPEHPEVQELEAQRLSDPLVSELLALQQPDGAWRRGTLGPGRKGSHVHTTALGLMRLGYLGFDDAFPPVQRAADYLFSQQRPDGSWPLTVAVDGELQQEDDQESIPQGYDMIPLQTVFPLRALAACGYATDRRTEKAYAWLLAQRLEDGAWPTGKAQGVNGRVAGYRRLPHSLWGCRSNTTGALICLALHPERRSSPPARRALDLLLGRETRERFALGFEVARILGAEPARGFMTFFARFDLGLLLWLCSRVGAGTDDSRVATLVDYIRSQQGEAGLWDYASKPQVTRWVSFDLLRSLAQLDQDSAWLTSEPPGPFSAYPKREKRY